MQAKEQMDERVAQYFSLYSLLFWPTVERGKTAGRFWGKMKELRVESRN